MIPEYLNECILKLTTFKESEISEKFKLNFHLIENDEFFDVYSISRI